MIAGNDGIAAQQASRPGQQITCLVEWMIIIISHPLECIFIVMTYLLDVAIFIFPTSAFTNP
jgi:hypothetical protein